MNIVFGLPFFKSFGSGWQAYYSKSSGPKFTEEQVRIADETSWALDNCHPIKDLLDGETHMKVCTNIRRGEFLKASETLG